MTRLIAASLVIAPVVLQLFPMRAEACGCFAPPDPTVPVLQAGERIVFAVENHEVTAHIQIQYSGAAAEFGWLLPLPSVPTLELGTEAIFSALTSATQPRFVLQAGSNNCVLPPSLARAASASADAGAAGGGPLVTQDSIGPYDFAVLKADSKEEMFAWLTANRYFIPTGTDATVGPYLNPGSYFLALKLKSGRQAGDIQPVALHYRSELPMIPIVLTSVAAQPNMGIQVWVLGDARAIPRNYNHVVINDAQINWLTGGANYNEVVIRAVSETPEKHAFVTEYAGTSSIMSGAVFVPGQFGDVAQLAAQSTPGAFVAYLRNNGFAATDPTTFAPTLVYRARQILLQALPKPVGLAVSDAEYLMNLDRYLDLSEPNAPTYDPALLAKQIDEAIVTPAKKAQALLDGSPKLTRLYTTLSPEDMTRDPVFSFNATLADVSNVHVATLSTVCAPFQGTSDAELVVTTAQGWRVSYGNYGPPRLSDGTPNALRVETLREEGAPETVIDNTAAIETQFHTSGCGCGVADPLMLAVLGLVLVARRRSANAC